MKLFVDHRGNHGKNIVVFLHGGGVSGWMWEKQANHFEKDYNLLIPDLPGHGRSGHIPFESIAGAAEQIIRIIQAHAGEGADITVIGFSLGAQILVQMLVMKPDLIRCAIISSALVRPIPIAKRLVKPTVRMTMPLIANKKFALLQAKQLYLDGEYFERYYQDSITMKPQNLVRVMQENMSFAIPSGFERCSARILVLVGAQEKKMSCGLSQHASSSAGVHHS